MAYEVIREMSVGLALILGAIVCFEDARSGKIRNKIIIIGFAAGLIFYGIMAVLILIGGADNFTKSAVFSSGAGIYFLETVVNIFVCVVLSFLFWYFRIWAAGDGKLFIMASFLLPLEYYKKSFFFFFPSLPLLINIFTIPAAVFFAEAVVGFLTDIYKKIKNQNIAAVGIKSLALEFLRKKEGIVNFFITLAMVAVFAPLLSLYSGKLLYGLIGSGVIVFAIIFILQRYFFSLSKIFFSHPKYFYLFLLVFSAITAGGLVVHADITERAFFDVLKIFEGSLAIFAFSKVLMYIYNYYEKKKLIENVPAGSLRGGEIIPRKLLSVLRSDAVLCDSFGDVRGDGLTKEQAQALNNWLLYNKSESVKIYKTIPFAVWIYVGLVSTVVLKESWIHFIKSLFG